MANGREALIHLSSSYQAFVDAANALRLQAGIVCAAVEQDPALAYLAPLAACLQEQALEAVLRLNDACQPDLSGAMKTAQEGAAER
jgi:hypothetical protein